jgi:DNA-binding LytR/AlgR family response regulator
MSPMSCLIIDDEPIARNILRDYISRDERLNLVGCYKSAGDALKEIGIKQSLLIFLDINMPKISGFELLRSMPQQPLVIFTTAFREYALEGFNMNAVDYLLKPFSFERFLQAVNKAYVVFASWQPELKLPQPSRDDIFVKSEGKLVRIHVNEIFFIEALKEYVKLVTVKGNYVTYQSMQFLQEKLPADQFFRIHRSYIVALAHVQMIEGNMVYVNKVPLPISRNCKDEFMQRITRDNLL